MTKTFSNQQRRSFVHSLQEIDRFWGEMFGDESYYDLHYSDLFTRMWLHAEHSFRKTELYGFMPRISHRTAVKYVQRAITEGLLIEEPDPHDGRTKRIYLSADLKQKIEQFLDHAITTLERKKIPQRALAD